MCMHELQICEQSSVSFCIYISFDLCMSNRHKGGTRHPGLEQSSRGQLHQHTGEWRSLWSAFWTERALIFFAMEPFPTVLPTFSAQRAWWMWRRQNHSGIQEGTWTFRAFTDHYWSRFLSCALTSASHFGDIFQYMQCHERHQNLIAFNIISSDLKWVSYVCIEFFKWLNSFMLLYCWVNVKHEWKDKYNV